MPTPNASVLSLGNCPLDPTLGSGKTRLHWAAGLRDAGFRVEVMDSDALTAGTPRIGTRFRLALGAVRNAKPLGHDIVECFGSELGWFTARLAKKRPRPLIIAHTDGLELLQGHLTPPPKEKPTSKNRLAAPLHRWLDWAAFRHADALVAGCVADIRFAQEKGLFGRHNAAAVNLGVDPEYLGIPFQAEKEHRVVYFGTWSERKAPQRIVRVMTEVLTRDPACAFDVLGAGGSAREIMAAFPEALRGRVTVHPKLPSAEVARTLLRAKVLFFPSHYEGFGLATSEAMGCSCAAVLTPTGFGADLTDGNEAMVRDFQDEPGMAANILSLLSDNALRLRVARAGWERVQKLDWTSQRRLLADTYRRWLDAWDPAQGRFRDGFAN